MEMRKITRCRPPSVDDAELGQLKCHYHDYDQILDKRCCFAEDGKDMYKYL